MISYSVGQLLKIKKKFGNFFLFFKKNFFVKMSFFAKKIFQFFFSYLCRYIHPQLKSGKFLKKNCFF